jgi:N-methylhydantoinase A
MSDVVRDFSRTVMIAVEPSSSGSKAFNRKGRRVFAKGAKKSTIRAVTINDLSSILDPHFADLEDKAVGEFQDEGLVGIPVRSADLRYAGQGYEINVPAGPEMLRQFHEAHRRRYGHADETRKVEVVNARVRMIAESERINFPPKAPRSMDSDRAIVKRRRVMFDEAWVDTPVFQRDLLMPGHKFGGPAIVHEYSATTVVASGCRVEVDDYSNLVIGV